MRLQELWEIIRYKWMVFYTHRKYQILSFLYYFYRPQILCEGRIRVPLKIVADKEYISLYPHWKEEIVQMIKEISEIFKREFGVEFEVSEIEEWCHSYKPIVATVRGRKVNLWNVYLFYQLQLKDNSVIIGFTGLKNDDLNEDEFTGFSRRIFTEENFKGAIAWLGSLKNNRILIADCSKTKKATLMHELGHLLGAIDIPEERVTKIIEKKELENGGIEYRYAIEVSIMISGRDMDEEDTDFIEIKGNWEKFDEENKQRILKNVARWKKLKGMENK